MPDSMPNALGTFLHSFWPVLVAVSLLLVAWLGWLGWRRHRQRRKGPAAVRPPVRTARPAASTGPTQRNTGAAPPAPAQRRSEPPATEPAPQRSLPTAAPPAPPLGAAPVASPPRSAPPPSTPSPAARPVSMPPPRAEPAPAPIPRQAPAAAPVPVPSRVPVQAPALAPVPARQPTPPPITLPAPPPSLAPAQGVRLLLVDDSAVARAKLRKLFDGAGYQVAMAKDGLDALEQLTTAAAGHFALMITDLEMPRMTGLELVEAIAARGDLQAMPILAISGHDDLQAQLRACPGVVGVFKKPWIDADLLTQVDALACPDLVRPLQF